MYVDLQCGGCEGHMLVESDDNDGGMWMLVHRFSNAHVACGFVTPPAVLENEVTSITNIVVSSPSRRRVVKRPRVEEPEE